jgi:hypothetical protein
LDAEGAPGKGWVSKSAPFQEPLCFLICLTLLMQAVSLPARMRARLRGLWWCGRLACGFAGGRLWREMLSRRPARRRCSAARW